MTRWERDQRFDRLNSLFAHIEGLAAFGTAEELAQVLIETHKPFAKDNQLCELYVAREASPRKYEDGATGRALRVGVASEILVWLLSFKKVPANIRLHYQGSDGQWRSLTVGGFLEECERKR